MTDVRPGMLLKFKDFDRLALVLDVYYCPPHWILRVLLGHSPTPIARIEPFVEEFRESAFDRAF